MTTTPVHPMSQGKEERARSRRVDSHADGSWSGSRGPRLRTSACARTDSRLRGCASAGTRAQKATVAGCHEIRRGSGSDELERVDGELVYVVDLAGLGTSSSDQNCL